MPMNQTLALLWIMALVPVSAGAAAPEASSSKAVLVTGASSGIGRKITEKLAADGYFVYAGARKEEDLKALGAIKNVGPNAVESIATARAAGGSFTSLYDFCERVDLGTHPQRLGLTVPTVNT